MPRFRKLHTTLKCYVRQCGNFAHFLSDSNHLTMLARVRIYRANFRNFSLNEACFLGSFFNIKLKMRKYGRIFVRMVKING